MNQRIFLVWLAVALAGCQTTGPTGTHTSVKSLPEYSAHMGCLASQAARYSKAQGSPLELGIIGSSACNGTRMSLYAAIAKIESRAYADGYIGAAEREEPKMIAAEIIRRRG